MFGSSLSRFTDDELRAELRRRQGRPEPLSFRCERCGAVEVCAGRYDLNWYQIQEYMFQRRHRDCPAYYMGGGI